MRKTRAGEFDSVITIFNAIGHLTKADYKKTLRNISKNLKEGGIYIFDIFNLNYMVDGTNITSLTIDKMVYEKNRIIRKIQYSTVDNKGVLASHTTSIVQTGETGETGELIESKGSQTLQIYSVLELQKMLEHCGFKLIKKYSIENKCNILFSCVFGKLKYETLVKWLLDSNVKARFQLQTHKHVWEKETRGV